MKRPRFKPVKTPKGWRLNVPPALSPDQKRSRRFFSNREEAEGFAAKLRAQVTERGTSARILAPTRADAAVRAFALLGEESDPETLIQAVREHIARHNMRTNSLPFGEAFRQFSESQTRSGSYQQSLRQYRARLSSLHDRMLCEITARDLEQAMNDFPPTVFNYGLRILGGLFNFALKRDFCASNPVEKLNRKKTPPKEVAIYTPEQAAALLAAASPHMLPWLAVCMFAGLRASEARQVVWGDFDFSENFIRVRAAISKTRRPRAIPMELNLRAWLLPYRRGDAEHVAPQGANVLRSQVRSAHREACVPQIKHGPRHSYASYLLARDGTVDALLLNMGHEDPATTFRHYHRVASERAARKFWAILPTCEVATKIISIS